MSEPTAAYIFLITHHIVDILHQLQFYKYLQNIS